MGVGGPRIAAASLLILVALAGLPFIRSTQAERVFGLTWDRTYVRGLAGPYSVHQTSDGGFIMSGPSGWVIKTNAAGMLQWEKRIVPQGYLDSNVIVTPTSDDGYVLAGSALPSCCLITGLSAWVVKLDHTGGVAWSRIYGGPWDALYSVQQTSDGGYVVMGNTQNIESVHVFNAWVIKLDPLGGIVWQKAFPGQDGSWVEQTSDGGYIMSGTVLADGKGAGWVVKLDSSGNTVWQKAFEVAPHSPAYQVHQTSDEGYIVLGQIDGRGGAWIFRLDSESNILWQKSYNGVGPAYPSSIEEMSDHGFIVSGRFNPASLSPQVGLWGPWLLSLDADGNMVWWKMYGLGNSGLQEVHETMDGGLIAVGNEATDCCGHLVWAMKLDSDGNVHHCDIGFPSNATLTDTSATVTTPSATSVDTPFTQSPTDVTVTRFMIMPQDQCRPKIDAL